MLEIIFWTLCALWLIAVGIWIYTMLNKKMRENMNYIYPNLAICVLGLIISILSAVIK